MAASSRHGDAGGILGRDLLGFIGSAALYGFAPRDVVRADPLELELYVAAAEYAVKHQADRDAALARAIVGELARSLKRR